ncbi:MAG TPA: SPOR domain-containing protein [Candidatus Polarisedimenticolaceae bacterium]|nr:SPOR domain-containing protein [Candidatus Polarisedimenticolaceae bacterium]
MSNDGGNGEEVREFRLEGLTLVVVATALVLALGGAFMLGRWVERGSAPPSSGGTAAAGEDPLANLARADEPADVDETSDIFDRADETATEPEREVRSDSGVTRGDAPASAPTESSGNYFVQVWAGRDRDAAELLVDKLERDGYAVTIVSDRVEGDTLFKVRVGGYPTEAEARRTSGELEGKGYRGAWVTSAS